MAAVPATPPVEAATPAPAAAQPLTQSLGGAAPGKTYCWGTGRRKTSVARVRVRAGEGKFIINKRQVDDFFKIKRDRDAIVAPLKATDSAKRVDVFVNVLGGGVTGQAGAIVLGLARALCKFNSDYDQALRDGDFLTRDSREVERKKYGQRGARRRFQFSKR